MMFLAVDTSGKQGSLALARAEVQAAADINKNVRSVEAGRAEIVETVALAGGTFSAQLIPEVAELLERHGVAKQDVAAFVVASGPGSFTGLRVGLAAVKGLAEVLQKPIVAVQLLEAVAFEVILAGRTIVNDMMEELEDCFVALDAGRNEVFFGEYAVSSNGLPWMVKESLTSRENLADFAVDVGRGCEIFTPDSNLEAFVKARIRDPILFNVNVVPRPNAWTIVNLGGVKLRRGLTISPEELEANYIRRSDAEIFAKG